MQSLVPKPGFAVERNVFFMGVLANSDMCRTEADVGLKEKCDWVGRGWNRMKKVIVRNGRFHIAIEGNCWSPNRALKLSEMCVLGGSLRTPIVVRLRPMWV